MSDATALHRAHRDAIRRCNPCVERREFIGQDRGPDLRHHAGVKSWAALERGTDTWTISDLSGACRIKIGRRLPKGRWEDDPDRIVTLPPGTTLDELCARAVEIIQAKAHERGELSG